MDRSASPVRLDSELSSPQEAEEDLNKVTSEGGELEEEKAQRGGGEDEEVGRQDEERGESSAEGEKGADEEGAKVSGECCGGDEEKIQEGEESEKLSGDGNSRQMEAECSEEKQNAEISRGRSRDEETDSEEEKVNLEGMKEGSEGEEDLKRCSLSYGALKEWDGEDLASSLEAAGDSDVDEPAALRPGTTRLCELRETGPAGVHPAEVDEESGPQRVSQKRESLAGSLTAEVWFPLGSPAVW